ncbi:toxin glutamine deamidase domain-containing protein [Mycolicibacterium sp. XJ775]
MHGRNRWNPNFLRGNNCAYAVAEELSLRHGRDITVDAPISPRGVQARSLFEAVGSAARFASYSEVQATLQRLGPGSSAVLTSRWRGRGQGGHAYLAVNDGGTIYLLDPHSGQRSGWPPHWGTDAVRRTAVGYLDADGVAVTPLDGNTNRQLRDADVVGLVQGDHTQSGDHAIAEDALGQRTPAVRPDELRNPLGLAEEAAARARNNATWWAGLSERQQQALIDTYPQHIGNAEGIPATARDAANHNVLQELRDRADRIQTKIDEFERPTRAERRFLAKFNQLDRALDKARADAARAGEDGPLMLAFDPKELGGDGRVLLSFGHDPYSSDSVSWHVPGVQTTMHSLLGFYSHSALNHLQSVRTENPELKASSIAWIGYDAPSGRKIWRAAGHGFARTGGDILHSDITAFNAVHESSSNGTGFTGNHVFGYSYGSTTTGYAGLDGRLGDHVSSVTLVGSPGAGPITHAADFGIGADNVFAASSSRDLVTALGGRTPGSSGRILGIGLGVDPAMHSFGAVRVTAEFPSRMNHLHTGGTHHAYFLHTRSTGPSESLANLGRIASGHSDRVAIEPHRTVEGRHTVEPAAGSSVRRIWNLPWRSGENCAQGVARELSAMYGREVQLATRPTRSGVPARALFEAVGSDATFATYAEIEQRLRELGDGSSAVLASRWSGGRGGGHAYLAVNVGGDIQLVDPHRGRSGWPPHWGQDAVSRTAVGYLDSSGNPLVRSAVDAPMSLTAADAIGPVRGHRDDPDFGRRQAGYRAQDPAARPVDSRYAQPLNEVVDNLDGAAVRQLAQDLSGTYGPHRIQIEGEIVGGEVMLTGKIFHGDTEIGTIQRRFERDGDGNLVAYHTGLVIKEEFELLRGQGFSKAVTAEFERFYVDSGVDRIELKSHDTGSNAWARRGFTWDPAPRRLAESLGSIKSAANRLMPTLSPEGRAALADMVSRLEPDHPRLPEPVEVATLATAAEPELGRQLLKDTGVNFVRHLPVAEDHAQPDNGLRSRLQRWLGLGGQRSSAQNCADGVAGVLTQRYERPFRLDVQASRTGVPAWALFRSVGSTAVFTTYDDVSATLHDLGDGSSAVLASRWSGSRQGGHAYLAVNDGGQIHLFDPHTGKKSGWPPHWGEQAVDRTAVGYLDADGTAVSPLAQAPLHVSLGVADGIGDVRGHAADNDFHAGQQEYRAQDPATRRVDTTHAQPLGEIVDSLDADQVRQLGNDLSGVYGPYRVEMFRAVADERTGEVIIGGAIISGDEEIGFTQQTYVRDRDGNLVAHQNVVDIPDRAFRGRGFSKALSEQLEQYYAISGVDRIELRTEQDGGYAWARQGFSWNPDPAKLQTSVDNVRNAAVRLHDQVGPEAQALLDDVIQRLHPSRPDLPEPIDLAALSTGLEPNLGRDLLTDTHWNGVKYFGAADAIGDVQGHIGYRDQDPATRTVDTRYAQPLGEVITESGDQVQAERFAEDLSGAYGPYRVEFTAEALPSAVQLNGEIFHGDKRIGEIERIFIRDDSGELVAHHNEIKIEDKELRGKGFSKAFLSEFDQYYARSGVDRIELLAVRDGAYAWARRGFTWDLRTDELQESLDSIKVAAQRLMRSTGTEARVVLEEVIGRLEPGHPRLPEPADLATLRAPGHPELGRELLRRTSWHGVKYVDEAPRYRSPDDVELAGFWDRIGQLDQAALSPETLLDAVYRPVAMDTVTGFYEGRVSGFKTSEVVRAQQHVAGTGDSAFFVSADIANLRGLNQASADRTEANAHFSGLSAAFLAALEESGADVVPMRIGGDELGAVVVGDIDEATIESAIATIRARAQQYAQQHNLADIPHPKHPGQPEYNGVGMHVGYAEVLPDLDVRDIFDDADLGVDRSKTRRSDVAGGPGRAVGADRADPAGAATPGRGDGTRTGPQATGSEGQVAGRPSPEGQAGQQLSNRSRYQHPDDIKRASFLAEAARLGAEGRGGLQALYESLGRDEVSGFYDGRASEFKTGEVARARQWVTETGGSGILVSAQLDNLSGLNAHVQNRAEVANAHYRAITQIFRTEIEATGATVVPMRTSGDRFDAVVIGAVDSAAVDAALARIDSRTAAYAQDEGLSDITNPSNAGRQGLRLYFGYSDLTAPGTLDEIIQTAERQMFGRQDSGDPRQVSEPDIDIPSPRQPDTVGEGNCAHGVADALSERYGREFQVAVEPSRTGVPARELYEAVGSASRFATYDQVEESLRRLGDGSSAVLTSRWRGGRSGGHAYLAVNDGGEIYLLDPTSGERTGWPPHWGQAAVDRTAVGYLDSNGDPINPLHDVPLRLGPAETVGDVRGAPADLDPTQLVRPVDDPWLAVARAKANASWWQGLSLDQRQAVIESYPMQIGNAEGIPPMVAHEANSLALQDWLAKGRELQTKLDNGVRLGWENHLQMQGAKVVGDALERATDAARRAGVDGPYLLRFDPDAHRGAGAAVVGFGVDPYLAESVSWHIPGRGMTILELGPGMGSALNHAMSVLLEDPTASASSLIWIGYDTMTGEAARVGGVALRSDIIGFNAGRDAWSGGAPFRNNHVFGHCQGSTVAGYAGEAGRLRSEINTVSLFGSPGLGPMNTAGEFGAGVGVYVAASSTDRFTWHGGVMPGLRGDFLDGFGVDPAMDFFGARRITAEFPLVEMTRAGDYDIHNFYYKFVDKAAGVRNESLANFGRIAAGHAERIEFDRHRGLVSEPDGESKVLDPAAARSVRIADLAVPATDPADNCAYGVAEALSQRYGRDIRIETAVTATGVPARSLFEALGSRADFATYSEVSERLAQLGPGSSAVLASRWAGVRQGGHAYLAVNDGGEIRLVDQRTGQRSGWPPHWGQAAVDRTAVGYLDEHGNAVAPLGDQASQLADAHAVGDVRGLRDDPDFVRRQQEYRAQDRSTRTVDTRYAEPVGDLVDNPGSTRLQQLADDLSGRYGPYRVEFEVELNGDQLALSGVILDGNEDIGSIDRVIYRDEDGHLVVHNGLMAITDGRRRGQGFSKALTAELERFYVRSGVDRIELTSDWQGSNAWARRGFTWGTDVSNLQGALDQIKFSAERLRERVEGEAVVVLDEIVARLEVDHPRLPEPVDLAMLATDEVPNLGRLLLENTSIDMVKYLPAPVADPLGRLGLPDHEPATLPEGQAITAFADGELRLRALNEQLERDGVTVEDRARQLAEARNALRNWAYGLMGNQVAAQWLAANTSNPTFEDLVTRNAERGLTGDAIYEAIIETSTHSRLAPGSLTDIETGAVYSQFELGLRALNEQMIRDGAGIDARARQLSGLRSTLRAWTRELMENRSAAEWLSANESAPTFEELVARYEAKGLTGEAVYQAIIDGATHSHYAAGTLSDEETRTVYTTYELRMRELRDQLLRDGVGAEERARTMYGMRATIRSWTRSLMENRELADWLNANEPNPTFDELVERNRAKGRVGDQIYEAIIASSTRSRGSVNADLGIDPENPPGLPPMRGPTDPPLQGTEEDNP